MILYKYVSHDTGLKILKNSQIGFSNANYFNDPFELHATYPSGDNNSAYINIRAIKRNSWAICYGVLSLTRQPLNSLMWAHYAKEHSGMVIGVDCTDKLFTGETGNLIPIQYGSVIYTNTKPSSKFLTKRNRLKIGGIYDFDIKNLERFQRMFLYKPMCWSYEEEIRIVKHIGNDEFKSPFNKSTYNNRPLYLLDLPIGSIKEIYIGLRNDQMKINVKKEIFSQHPNVSMYRCEINPDSWNLKATKLKKI